MWKVALEGSHKVSADSLQVSTLMQRPCPTVWADMFVETKSHHNGVSYSEGRIQIEGVRERMLRIIFAIQLLPNV
jgi:hypothetical protein